MSYTVHDKGFVKINPRPRIIHTIAFSAKYNVLLAKPSPGKVQILNSETGSVIQEIDLSFLGSAGYLGMHKDDQVVTAHTDSSKTIKHSFLKLSF